MEYRRMDTLIAMINTSDNVMILAMPNEKVKAITKDSNPTHWDIMITQPVSNKEEFKSALMNTINNDNKMLAINYFTNHEIL